MSNRTAPARGTDPYLAGDLLVGRLLTRAARNRTNLRSPQGRDDALLWSTGRLILWIVRHIVALSTVVTVAALWLRFGPLAVVVPVAWLVAVVLLLRQLHRRSYDWLDGRVRRRWRIATIYDPLWRETMFFTGLARSLDGIERIPHRRRMRSTRWGDRMVVTLLVARADARWHAGERVHTPRPGDPLVVVFLDELALLTSYIDEGKERLKSRARRAISILLSQGRAPGMAVVANLQDPRKETIPQRDLFPTRICLRQTDPEMVDLILNKGAHDRGARAEEIPDKDHGGAGIGYVLLDGQREPTRVRASWWDDPDITAIVDRYAPVAPATGIEIPQGAAA